MNNEDKKLHQLVQLSKTRWLVFSAVIDKILKQWVELKTYFSIVIGGQKKELHG